jgi:hypothetical protein
MGRQSLATIIEWLCKVLAIGQANRITYRFENAPRSAKSASTPERVRTNSTFLEDKPVKQRRIPPRDRQPSVLFRTKYSPAKYGENAFKTEWSNFTRF